jgi:hypothetical protein
MRKKTKVSIHDTKRVVTGLKCGMLHGISWICPFNCTWFFLDYWLQLRLVALYMYSHLKHAPCILFIRHSSYSASVIGKVTFTVGNADNVTFAVGNAGIDKFIVRLDISGTRVVMLGNSVGSGGGLPPKSQG